MQSILQHRRLKTKLARKETLQGGGESVVNEHGVSTASSSKKDLKDETGDALRNEHILVEWDGPLDPSAPRNWSLRSKIGITLIVWINVFALEWCSAADSQASTKISTQFHVSKVAESLSVYHQPSVFLNVLPLKGRKS